MALTKKHCFQNSSGEDIYLFNLSNSKETEVVISNYGAILISMKVKNPDGTYNDLVLGFDDMNDYFSENYLQHYAYMGAACGRYANRIKDGKFILDRKEYQLSRNMGNDQLHGGKEGFDKKIWDIIKTGDSENPVLGLRYLSKDGEEGFPGNLATTIRFQLTEEDVLSYEFFAETDKPTAVNLTHHSYFNLNNGEGTVENHEIRIYASNILSQDEGLVCNGDLLPVENTPFDFRNFKAINKEWNPSIGYDQCFVIDNKTDDLSLVAEARSLQSGILLQIFSTEPAVQFYTGIGLGNLKGKNGVQYGPFSGFCLETHQHPNAINIPHFPNTVLRPGGKYYQKNVYKIIQAPAK